MVVSISASAPEAPIPVSAVRIAVPEVVILAISAAVLSVIAPVTAPPDPAAVTAMAPPLVLVKTDKNTSPIEL